MPQEPASAEPSDGARPVSADDRAEPPESVEEPRRRSRRWRWRTRLVLLFGALVLIVGGLAVWRYLSSYESTDDAQVDAHLYPVSARVSGHVIRVNVDDNEYVKKGT